MGVRDMNVAALRDCTSKKGNEERLRAIFNEEDRRRISSIPISAGNRVDGYWWKGETSGNYSVKSGYRLQVEETAGTTNGVWSHLWTAKVPPKFKYFMWQVLDGSIPTVDKLRQRGIEVPNGCKLCDAPTESLEHAFRECSWARLVWQAAGFKVEGRRRQKSGFEEV
ncbi:unnamed protein product [Cuscuta europaea]|uniref:Reverse transcriptase zinc-binding domain-containing protein n=1 Tax=Cuscuta europaea TaxID=41803 RepID=A0A9P0YZJ6_CUSEU|nr:unnamed protein product [Cuscuta europaea]